MALYSYEAFSKEGKRVSGVLDAPSSTAVKEQLARQGMFPISIKAAQETARYGLFRRLLMRKPSVKDKILFSKQLAILLRSGIPLLQALELLIEQFQGSIRSILVSLKDDVKEGSSLADAMQKFPQLFDNIYVQLVRAGEASGQLEVILERLTEFLERREAISKKVKGAMQGPIIQLVVAVLVVVAMITFVVPKLTTVFTSQGRELPGATRFLIGLSGFVTSYYLFIIIFIIALIASFTWWKRTPSGARRFDEIKLRIPVVGYLTKTSAVVQFSYTLGMLLEGGVNLAQALDIVCNIIDNRILAEDLKEARDKIIKQGKIAQYLKQTGVFPPIATYLIQTGEESGQLDKMLLTVANNYEKEYNETIDKLTGFLGPAMLLFMAVIVGFIVMAIAVPIMKMGEIEHNI